MTDAVSDWKVGDEVIITGKYVRLGRTVITKIGRKYFYIASNPDTMFQLSNGCEKPDKWGDTYKARAWRPEAYEAHRVRSDVLHKIKLHGVSWGTSYGKTTFRAENFSTARLFELLNFLDQVAEETAIVDLDKDVAHAHE